MKETVIKHFCQCLYGVYEIPIRLFKRGELLLCHENTSLSEDSAAFLTPQINYLLNESKKNLDIVFSEGIFAYALIRNKGTDLSIIIGPTRSVPLSKTMVKEFITSHALPAACFDNLYEYLSSIHILQHGRFLHLISAIFEALNNETADIKELEQSTITASVHKKAQSAALKHAENLTYDFGEKLNYYDSEQRILYYIANGLVEQVKIFWREAGIDNNVPDTPEVLRIIKNNCIVSITLITRAALTSEMDPEDIYTLRDTYLQMTEECTSVPEVLHLRYDIIIEFAQRIRNLRIQHTDNPMINRVLSYIQKNLAQKFSLDELADLVKTHKAYLSVKFKEVMGIGITDFINRQKINEAKRFLRFTDKSLIEISNYFSFSSQSYFQKIFKEIAGMTPLEYRNQKEF